MAAVFVLSLVTSFFAFAPAAQACESQVAIHKIETGADAPGASYTIRMSGRGFTREVVVPAGGVVTIAHVPPGTYTLTELDAPAGATIVPNPVVVGADYESTTVDVVVTNPYPAGRLAIAKVETGATAPGGTYTFDITGPIEVGLTATVAAGDTWTSDWLPLGTYTVTERDAPEGATIEPNPVTLTEDGQTVTVTATNPYRDLRGKLAITKIETGATAPGGTYTFDITGPIEVGLTATVAAGDTWTSDWLPLGTYTVTERDAPEGATIEPNPVTLTEDEQTVTVTATNPYRDLRGKLAITKIETGENPPGDTYTMDVAGPGGLALTVTVAAGDTWTSDWLPLGTYTVAERDAPEGATIEPNPVTLTEDGQTVTVTVTNPTSESKPPVLAGRIAITKVVSGEPDSTARFTLDVTGPESFSVTVTAGTTWTSELLPLGTYTITERNAPAGATISPNPVVLEVNGVTVAVTVTNPAVKGDSGTLPPTGASPWQAGVLAAVLVATGGSLLMLRRTRRDA